MKRVLVNARIAEESLQRLQRRTRVFVDQRSLGARLLAYTPFEGIVIPAATTLDGATMDRMPGLEVVARLGIGVENIELQAATDRGIVVVHTPDAPTSSTAEHALCLILALARNVLRQDKSLRSGRWEARWENPGRDVQGLVVGIVGFGRVGRRLAELLAPLGCRILVFGRSPSKDRVGAPPCEFAGSLEELVGQVDVLSLHLPLSEKTRHIIDRTMLSSMKPGAYLVNTSRGGLVDEEALVEVLRSGRLAGAAVDVFEQEPPPKDSPLLKLENVVVTPHSASLTREGFRRLSEALVGQLLAALEGERPDHVANPEVLDRAGGPGEGGEP